MNNPTHCLVDIILILTFVYWRELHRGTLLSKVVTTPSHAPYSAISTLSTRCRWSAFSVAYQSSKVGNLVLHLPISCIENSRWYAAVSSLPIPQWYVALHCSGVGIVFCHSCLSSSPWVSRGHFKFGILSGGSRTWMLLPTPGILLINPRLSNLTTIWWTMGAVTLKYCCKSASAGGRPFTLV